MQRSLADATQRIQGIIDAAEQAANEIQGDAEAAADRVRAEAEQDAAKARADAEREAEAYLEQRRSEADKLVERRAQTLREMVQSLLGRAENLREQAEQMATDVEGLFSDLSRDEPVEPTKPALEAVAPAEPWSGPKPVAYPGTADGSGLAEAPSEEAVLRATQLAVAGSDRAEIEATLRSEFGVDDPGPLLDDILGSPGG